MSFPPTVFTLLCFLVVGLLVPTGFAADLVPLSPTTSEDCGPAISVPGQASVNPWGTSCYANAVTGVSSVASFSFYVQARSAGDAPKAAGYILEIPNLTVVSSVAISLSNDSANYTAAQATFPAAVPLNATGTYYFAFCLNGTKTIEYNALYNGTAANAFAFCTPDTTACLSSISSWTNFGGALKFDFSGPDCPKPSSASRPSSFLFGLFA
jgi:hypothetical protein